MVRISAIFIAVCMVLIAASLGLVVYLRFGFTGAESALLALAVLTGLAVYNAVAARTRDRSEATDQITDLARGADDLARQVNDIARRLTTLEANVGSVIDRALSSTEPLAAELRELAGEINEIRQSVEPHETAAGNGTAAAAGHGPANGRSRAAEKTLARYSQTAPANAAASAASIPADMLADADLATVLSATAQMRAFSGLSRDGIIEWVRSAIDAERIELYLQPIVTLPQRKVRYYEALSRLKTEIGDVVPAADFLTFAITGGLMPRLDALALRRSIQVVRRLLLQNRELGLFCNISGATLRDAAFARLVEFADANRAVAPALVLEFTQSAVRGMGPVEHNNLAALAGRGFHFSMDNLTTSRVDARELSDRGFRFVKVPPRLLYEGAADKDATAGNLCEMLARFNIDIIAERIEDDATAVDLLDYDVRFAQGFLFSPPRPMRADILQSGGSGATTESTATAPGAMPMAPASQNQNGGMPTNGIGAHLAGGDPSAPPWNAAPE